jgi:hypothetical protein
VIVPVRLEIPAVLEVELPKAVPPRSMVGIAEIPVTVRSGAVTAHKDTAAVGRSDVNLDVAPRERLTPIVVRAVMPAVGLQR